MTDPTIRHLHAERSWDTAPASVCASLMDVGTYLASVSTTYRVLRAAVSPARADSRAAWSAGDPWVASSVVMAGSPE